MSALASPPSAAEDGRLALLAGGDDPLPELLREAGAGPGWWPAAARWRRVYGRYQPQREPYAVIAYQSPDPAPAHCLVQLYARRPARPGPHALGVALAGVGWVWLAPFARDPRLPSLAGVLAAQPAAEVVRYRPLQRCTLRLPGPDGEARFAKVFPDARGARLHRDGLALWEAARRGDLGFDVAEPGSWSPAELTLWQGSVAGEPVLAELFGPRGPALAERMGAACASLTGSGLQPSLRFGAGQQLQRSRHYAAELALRLGDQRLRLAGLMRRLEALHAAAVARPERPIHAAPHPHQWLLAGERLGLVDFDRFALGDPELDLATFLAEMDFEDPAQVPVAAINEGFWRGYERVHGPLDPGLLAAYRAHKRLAKAVKAVRSLRLDADVKARRHLSRACAAAEGER